MVKGGGHDDVDIGTIVRHFDVDIVLLLLPIVAGSTQVVSLAVVPLGFPQESVDVDLHLLVVPAVDPFYNMT